MAQKSFDKGARWIHNVSLRFIKQTFLRAKAVEFPRAAAALASWMAVVRRARWKTTADFKKAFHDVDPVKVRSGRTVYICNIRRNEYRLIIAVHFNVGKVFTLRFFTHKEYEKTDWKNEL
jgi:mRNA interferase HigB